MKSRCNCPLHLSNNPSYDYCRFGRLDIYIWYKAMSEGAGTNTSGSLFNFIREIWRLIKDCKRPKYIRKFRIFGGKFIFVIDAAFCNPSIFRKGHQSSSVYLELRQQNRPASNSPPPLPFTAGGVNSSLMCDVLRWSVCGVCSKFDDDGKFQLMSSVQEVREFWWWRLRRMYVVVVCSEAGKLPRLFVRVKFPFPLINNGTLVSQ